MFHRFTSPLPRERAAAGVCDLCDSAMHAHAGPVVSHGYRHRLHLVAEALVAVGRGVRYPRATQRARAAAGREPVAGSGQMDARGRRPSWPRTPRPSSPTLVPDSTDFHWTQRPHAYPAAQVRHPGRLRLHRPWTRPHLGHPATPTAQAHDWVHFLTSMNLHHPPASVVLDDDLAIEAALRRMWRPQPGPSLAQPFFFACEHHLRAH